MSFRRNLVEALRADPIRGGIEKVGVPGYTRVDDYEDTAPAIAADDTLRSALAEGTLQIKRVSDNYEYVSGTDFTEVAPQSYHNLTITAGTAIRISYVIDEPDSTTAGGGVVAGGGGHEILDESGAFPQRRKLRITGASKTLTDSPGLNETLLALSGVDGYLSRGEYDPLETYDPNDVVEYGGTSFIALTTNTGVTPVRGANWMVSAEKGDDGLDGADGRTVLSGTAAPTGGDGVNGDFYIRTSDWTIYGPKTAGAWGSPTLIQGTDGLDGADGRTVLSGTVAPTGGVGADGDFYIRTSDWTIYGPKVAGAWGAPASLVGPEGDPGIQGPPGDKGETGGVRYATLVKYGL